jgi:hypothetical protein
MQMVSKFLIKYGDAIRKEDVILISSATQLAKEGLEGYVTSILDTADRLQVGSRMGCRVLPCPFVLLGGNVLPALTNAILDFQGWVRLSGFDVEGVLNDSFGVIEHAFSTETGEKLDWQPASFKLPLSLPSRKKLCVSSTGRTNLPKSVRPVLECTEKLIVASLARNLNEKMGCDLDCDPRTTRSKTNSTKECLKFVLIGGPHAEAVARHLEAGGAEVQLLLLPHYRDCAVQAGKLEEGLKKLSIDSDSILVFMVFDSGHYMVRTDEGALIPPCKRADGTYHIDGVLELLGKDMQYRFFKLLMKEVKEYMQNRMIFAAPLPAYLDAGCCLDTDHVANRQSPDYRKTLEEGIYNSRANIKNFAFRHGLRRCVTISTWTKIKRMEDVWEGPTQLRPDGYRAVASAIVDAVAEITRKRQQLVSEDSRPSKKQRMEAAPRGTSSLGEARVSRVQNGERGQRGQRGKRGPSCGLVGDRGRGGGRGGGQYLNWSWDRGGRGGRGGAGTRGHRGGRGWIRGRGYY